MSFKLETPVVPIACGGAARRTNIAATSIEQEIQQTIRNSSELIQESNYAGRLFTFVPFWSEVIRDRTVLNWVKGYTIPFLRTQVQHNLVGVCKFSRLELSELNSEVSKLLSAGTIEECFPCQGQFLSIYFLVTNPNAG